MSILNFYIISSNSFVKLLILKIIISEILLSFILFEHSSNLNSISFNFFIFSLISEAYIFLFSFSVINFTIFFNKSNIESLLYLIEEISLLIVA